MYRLQICMCMLTVKGEFTHVYNYAHTLLRTFKQFYLRYCELVTVAFLHSKLIANRFCLIFYFRVSFPLKTF